ncbi:MAG: GNAT family N-acetyltransferase [Candidatus Kariarchaeaceae archaeon]|jgi:ribosomal protein S18 acetylase RimI-like enzyme
MIQIREYQKENGHNQGNLRVKLLDILHEVDQDFFPPLSNRKKLEFWLDLFEKGSILFAMNGKKIAGFLAYYPSLSGEILDELRLCVNVDPIRKPTNGSELYEDAYLHFIAISPHYRGRKIGNLLMEALHLHAQKQEATKLRVITWSTNISSLNLYKNNGYYIINEVKDDRAKGVDSIYLEKNLQRPKKQDLYYELLAKEVCMF